MKQEDLLEVIGELDEDILNECEAVTVPRSGRLAWRIIMAAALICALCVGAAAVSQQFMNQSNATPEISHQDISWSVMEVDEDGQVGAEEYNSSVPGVVIRAELETDPNAPIQPKLTFAPKVPEYWVTTSVSYALTGDEDEISQYDIFWEPFEDSDGVISSIHDSTGSHCEDYVSFRQESVFFYNNRTGTRKNQLAHLTSIPSRVPVTVEVVTLAEISMIRVDIPGFSLTEEDRNAMTLGTSYMRSGETRLYWSDGSSILSLVCPGWMEDSQIEDLIRSIYVVEDIQTYLNELGEQHRQFREDQTE